MKAAERPALLVGIDTEGDNQWDLDARRHQRFENIYALERLHDFFATHRVRPTYVVTHPVARDPRSAEVLRRLLTRGDCEIGAHHHVWETPPFDEKDVERHSYALELPLEQFDAQLAALTTAITEAVGTRPVSYRSGRYGFSGAHVSSLERAGYLIDSSVVPLLAEAHKGGPDFSDAPLAPYFLSYDRATRAGSSSVLELPVSCQLNRRVPAAIAHAYARAPWAYQTKRILRLLKIARVDWLRPSFTSAEHMNLLGRAVVDRGVPMLNLIFHSSEAIAGGSPYNRTGRDIDAFFNRLGTFLSYATGSLGAEPMTFAEFRSRYCARLSRHSPPAA